MQQDKQSKRCPGCGKNKLLSGWHYQFNAKINGKPACMDCYVEWLIEKQGAHIDD